MQAGEPHQMDFFRQLFGPQKDCKTTFMLLFFGLPIVGPSAGATQHRGLAPYTAPPSDRRCPRAAPQTFMAL